MARVQTRLGECAFLTRAAPAAARAAAGRAVARSFVRSFVRSLVRSFVPSREGVGADTVSWGLSVTKSGDYFTHNAEKNTMAAGRVTPSLERFEQWLAGDPVEPLPAKLGGEAWRHGVVESPGDACVRVRTTSAAPARGASARSAAVASSFGGSGSVRLGGGSAPTAADAGVVGDFGGGAAEESVTYALKDVRRRFAEVER